jgi:hypothetical protein
MRYIIHIFKCTSKTYYKSRDSLVGIALAYGLDDGVLEFDSRRGLGIFLFTAVSRTALEPTSLLSNGHQGFFPWG